MDMVKFERESLDSWVENANLLAQSNLVPPAYRGQPANILVAQQIGAPLGFGTLEAVNGIAIIEGKPSMSADLVQAAVRRAGHRLRVTGDDTFAEAVVIRADDPDFEFRVRWDIDRAQQAGLLSKKGGSWQRYPAAMLRARAITEVARMACADALHGVIYTPEELGAEVTEAGDPIQMQATPRQAPQQAQQAPQQQAPQQQAPQQQPPQQQPPQQQPPRTAHQDAGQPRTISQDWAGAADACATVDRIRELWREASGASELGLEIAPGVTVQEYLQQRASTLAAQAEQAEQAEQAAASQPRQQGTYQPPVDEAPALLDDVVDDIVDGELIEEELL